MTYDLLMAMSLESLADMTLNESRPSDMRLVAFEALNARIRECESAWAGWSDSVRAKILGALAMNPVDIT